MISTQKFVILSEQLNFNTRFDIQDKDQLFWWLKISASLQCGQSLKFSDVGTTHSHVEHMNRIQLGPILMTWF